MPRYQFRDPDPCTLAVYLKSLSGSPSPAVDPFAIQLASVIQYRGDVH